MLETQDQGADIQASHRLLKLLVEVYEVKPLAARLAALGPEVAELTAARLKRWKSDPVASPIALDESTRAVLRAQLLPARPAHWDAPEFEFIDLFAGIGGIRRGFEQAGGKCRFTSEWDDRARRTYLANHFVDDEDLEYFLDTEDENSERNRSFMDITRITRSGDPDATEDERRQSILKHIPEHDVLLAGFPCQPFSVAGVSKKNSLGHAHGFECTTQGTLFFDVQQILNVRRPRFFVLENVKNLKGHDKGNTFATIIRSLDEIGYWVADISSESDNIEVAIQSVRKRSPEPTIIDGAAYTPQHRERIVLVGIRKDLMEDHSDFSSLSLRNVERPESRYSVAEILCDLTAEQKQKYTLTPNLWNYLYHYALKHQSKGNGFGFGLIDPTDPAAVTRTLSARYYKDGSEILINQDGLEADYLLNRREPCIRKNTARAEYAAVYAEGWRSGCPTGTEDDHKLAVKEGERLYDERHGRYAQEFDSTYKTPRRLMPRECARLMGFERPDKYRTEQDTDFRIVCADSSAYKQFGNSVVVPVFAAVARLLLPLLIAAKNPSDQTSTTSVTEDRYLSA